MMGKYCGDQNFNNFGGAVPPSHVTSSYTILIHFQSNAGYSHGSLNIYSGIGDGFKMEYNPTGIAKHIN